MLPQAIISALAAFQERAELQKAQAGLLTSASLRCSCRQAYTPLFSLFFSRFLMGLDKLPVSILRVLPLISLKGALGATTVNLMKRRLL